MISPTVMVDTTVLKTFPLETWPMCSVTLKFQTISFYQFMNDHLQTQGMHHISERSTKSIGCLVSGKMTLFTILKRQRSRKRKHFRDIIIPKRVKKQHSGLYGNEMFLFVKPKFAQVSRTYPAPYRRPKDCIQERKLKISKIGFSNGEPEGRNCAETDECKTKRKSFLLPRIIRFIMWCHMNRKRFINTKNVKTGILKRKHPQGKRVIVLLLVSKLNARMK